VREDNLVEYRNPDFREIAKEMIRRSHIGMAQAIRTMPQTREGTEMTTLITSCSCMDIPEVLRVFKESLNYHKRKLLGLAKPGSEDLAVGG